MTEYVSRFYINILDQVTDRILGLFSVQMKVVMNQESFNDFINIATDSLSEALNRIVGYQGEEEGGYTRAEQIYALNEAYDRIRNFFGEDADITLDSNVEWYGMENTVERIGNYIQPIVELQILSFPTFEFVQLTGDRFNEIQEVFLRTHILA